MHHCFDLQQVEEEAANMYLQYYINENGDKVYTTKVCDDDLQFSSLFRAQ